MARDFVRGGVGIWCGVAWDVAVAHHRLVMMESESDFAIVLSCRRRVVVAVSALGCRSMGMSDTKVSEARERLDQEMVTELLARRTRAQTRKQELLNAATELAQIDQMLVVIEQELAAYGYRDPVLDTTSGLNAAAIATLTK